MTDQFDARPALLRHINDDVNTEPYRDGHLVAMPLHYSDGDPIELMVTAFDRGFLISDRGIAELRLSMTGVNLSNERILSAIESSTRGMFGLGHGDGVISKHTTPEAVGEDLFAVAEACMRVEQLRYMAPAPKQARFSDTVVRRVEGLVDSRAQVSANYSFTTRSGIRRRATAAVTASGQRPLLMQAVGRDDGTLNYPAVEHGYFVLDQAVREDFADRIAVLPGVPSMAEPAMVSALKNVARVAFAGDGSLRETVSNYLHAVA